MSGEAPVSTGVLRATLTLELAEGLVITYERGPAVDTSLAWHWFPTVVTALTGQGRERWTRGQLVAGSAPDFVLDAVRAHRPGDR